MFIGENLAQPVVVAAVRSFSPLIESLSAIKNLKSRYPPPSPPFKIRRMQSRRIVILPLPPHTPALLFICTLKSFRCFSKSTHARNHNRFQVKKDAVPLPPPPLSHSFIVGGMIVNISTARRCKGCTMCIALDELVSALQYEKKANRRQLHLVVFMFTIGLFFPLTSVICHAVPL